MDSKTEDTATAAAAAAARPTDEAIRSQMEEIKTQVTEQPALGATEPCDALLVEYADNDRFHPQIKDLMRRYVGLQRSQGDGNCFYRAYVYSYFQNIRGDAGKVQDSVVRANGALASLVEKHGYASFTVEDFAETFVEELEALLGRSAEEV